MAKIPYEKREVVNITAGMVKHVLNQDSDRFKGVTFIKKDGSLRKMNFRQHVKKHVKGTGNRPTAPKLRNVFDVQIDNHRCFYEDKVLEICHNNKIYKVVD